MSATARHRHTSKHRYLRQPITMGLAAAAALAPLAATPPAGASVLPPGPSDVRTLSPVRNYIDKTLMGAECLEPNVCTPINYLSFFTAGGVAKLDAVLKGNLDPNTVVFAYSNGAQVATLWLAQHGDDPGAPSPDTVKFVLMGNSYRTHGGVDAHYGYSQPSDYQVIDIARQYDPVADYPDDHTNLLAVLNSLAASPTIHDYRPVDITDPNNIVWTEGNITYVLVPTENLPLLDGLRRLGLNDLADQRQAILNPKIDAAYDRSYIPAEALAASTASTLVVASPVASAPAVTASKYVAPVTISAPTTDVAASPSTEHNTTPVAVDGDAPAPGHRIGRAGTVRTLTRAVTQTLRHVSSSLRSTAGSESSTGDTPAKRTSARQTSSSDQDQRSSSGSASNE